MLGQPSADAQRSAQAESERLGVHPLPTPSGLSPNTGPLAAAAWLLARGLFPKERAWSAVIVLATGTTRFEIEIFSEEWGFAFHHDDRTSWIRVTDIPFVHGHDDFELLREVSSLREIAKVVRLVENRYQIAFDRDAAVVETTIEDGESAIRDWVASL